MQRQAATSFGRYELLTRLARGGMAELFLARLRGLGGFAKLVAIKRILPHLSEDQSFVEMFLNEGRIAAKLAHQNVCQVHELGEVDGQLFLAMEYLTGVEWAELVPAIPQRSLTTLRIAAGVIAQASEGLHYAHELRGSDGRPTPVVHRDVSPQNLFLTVDGACKVLDFGVSKMVTDADRTRSGVIKGKLPYMPPEQLRGEPVDSRADVFAMGVVLWEALTGQRLFLRANDFLIWKAISEEPIAPVTQFCADYGADLDGVVARALERDRERRYPTIRALADELRQVTARIGGPCLPSELGETVRACCATQVAQRDRIVADATALAIQPSRATTTPMPVSPSETHSVQLRDESMALGRRRRRWLGAVLASIAIGAGVGTVLRFVRSDAPDQRAPLDDAALAVAVPPAAAPPPSPVGTGKPAPDPEPPTIDREPAPPAPERHVRPAPAAPGQYSIDSNPYATIYIDGKRRDQTPLFRISLPAGRHRVRAVLADGRERSFTVQIAPGKELSSGTLAW